MRLRLTLPATRGVRHKSECPLLFFIRSMPIVLFTGRRDLSEELLKKQRCTEIVVSSNWQP